MERNPGFNIVVNRTSCGKNNGLTSNLTFLTVLKNILIKSCKK